MINKLLQKTKTLSVLLLPMLLSYWGVLPGFAAQSTSPQPVVRAVLFYSPYCGHCELIITKTLPPLFEKYGEQLSIVGVDISQPGGQVLFTATLSHFKQESGGVPFLVVGDTFLVGSIDIPGRFPGLIDKYLAQGGIDWPAIPGLAEAMSAAEQPQPPAATPTTVDNTPLAEAVFSPPEAQPTETPLQVPMPGLLVSSTGSPSLGEKFSHDPQGNTLAVIILVGMIATLAAASRRFRGTSVMPSNPSRSWVLPALALAGLGIAGYLAFVEITHVQAVCVLVGDCNTVQQSEYARLFGIFPIGVLGVIGYAMILAAWQIGRSNNQRQSAYANLALFLMSGFGVLFSIYLTFLEPFVIGATCAWCLTSAILVTCIFWLTINPAKAALASLSRERQNVFAKQEIDHQL